MRAATNWGRIRSEHKKPRWSARAEPLYLNMVHLVVAVVLVGFTITACSAGSTPWEEHGEERYGNLDVLQKPQIDNERVIETYNSSYARYERIWAAPDDCAEANEAAQTYLQSAGASMVTGGESGWGLASSFTGETLAVGAWMNDHGCPQVSGSS